MQFINFSLPKKKKKSNAFENIGYNSCVKTLLRKPASKRKTMSIYPAFLV